MDYFKDKCIPLDTMIEKIKGGVYGDFKKIQKMSSYQTDAKKYRISVWLENDIGEVKKINLLCAFDKEKRIYVNARSFELSTNKPQETKEIINLDEINKHLSGIY